MYDDLGAWALPIPAALAVMAGWGALHLSTGRLKLGWALIAISLLCAGAIGIEEALEEFWDIDLFGEMSLETRSDRQPSDPTPAHNGIRMARRAVIDLQR